VDFKAHFSGSSGNLYSVTEGNKHLLIECGVSIRKIRKALEYGLSDYGDCLVSHEHLDHAQSAKDIMKAGINVHCTIETAMALGLDLRSHRLHVISANARFDAGGFQVLPFATEHDCPGSVGYVVMSPYDKLLFLTDSYFVRYRFNDLTLIAVECNWSTETLSEELAPSVKKRLLTSHFNLDHVKEFLKSNELSRVREIHLLHLSRDNANAELFRDQIERLTGKPVFVGV
jgi:phosphoribosyl 1,2-cyclic phosphodiesterase